MNRITSAALFHLASAVACPIIQVCNHSYRNYYVDDFIIIVFNGAEAMLMIGDESIIRKVC